MSFSITTARESQSDRDLTHVRMEFGGMVRECTFAHLERHGRAPLHPEDVCRFLRSAIDEIERHPEEVEVSP